MVPISAIEHFEYCPRQCALIHGEGQWAENAHTIRGSRTHRRVDSGEDRIERGRRVVRTMQLWSDEFGLIGRADAVEFTDDSIWPVEYKSGSQHGLAAHLQVCAQALCLEEMFRCSVPIGFLWFGGPRKRVRVEIDSDLRSKTIAAIVSIRSFLLTGELPSAPNDRRCDSCQLQPNCLPSVVTVPPPRFRQTVHDSLFKCAC